jgi:hypothetical protein
MKLRYAFRRYRSGTAEEKKKLLDDLRSRCGPSLYHPRQDTTARTEAAPSKLPSALVDTDLQDINAYLAKHISSSNYISWAKPLAYDWLTAQDKILKDHHYDFISRVHRPCVPNIVDHIYADMKRNGRSFGSVAIHTRLTLEQLEQLKDKRSELATDFNYVRAGKPFRHRHHPLSCSYCMPCHNSN